MVIYEKINNMRSLKGKCRVGIRNKAGTNTFYYVFTKYYLIPFIISCLVSVLLAYWKIMPSDLSSAQYLVSALVQGEAAILAIMISVSIFAVSNSQSYSPRIINIFLDKDRNPHFWCLLVIYVFSLIYGTFVLKLLKADDSYEVSNLQTSIWIICFLGIQAFSYLSFYISSILTTLKPSEIIAALSDKININDILDESTENKNFKLIAPDLSLPKSSIIRPIIDIINTSIINNNNETAIIGMQAIEKKITYIIKERSLEAQQYCRILEVFREKFLIIGIFSIEKSNHESISQVTKSMIALEVAIFEIQQQPKSIKTFFNSLEEIAASAIEKGNEPALSQILKSVVIFGIDIFSIKYDTELTDYFITFFNKVVIYAIRNEKDMLGAKTVTSTGVFGIEVLSKKYSDEFAEQLRLTLESLGMYATRVRKINTGYKIVVYLLTIRNAFDAKNKDYFLKYDQSISNIIGNAAIYKEFPLIFQIKQILCNYQATTVSIDIEKMDSKNYRFNGTLYPV